MKLREYLDSNGIKSTFFAKKIDVTPQYLAALLSGRRKPSLTLANKIRNATNNQVLIEEWVDDLEQDK